MDDSWEEYAASFATPPGVMLSESPRTIGWDTRQAPHPRNSIAGRAPQHQIFENYPGVYERGKAAHGLAGIDMEPFTGVPWNREWSGPWTGVGVLPWHHPPGPDTDAVYYNRPRTDYVYQSQQPYAQQPYAQQAMTAQRQSMTAQRQAMTAPQTSQNQNLWAKTVQVPMWALFVLIVLLVAVAAVAGAAFERGARFGRAVPGTPAA